MKKSNQFSNKAISRKDLAYAISLFSLFAICIYGILVFIWVLEPHFSGNEGKLIWGLQRNLVSTSVVGFCFSATEPIAIRVVSILAGASTGILQFSFAHRKSYLQGLLSMGIKRNRLFLNRMLIPLIALAAVSLPTKLLALKFNVEAYGISAELLLGFFADWLPILASALLGFFIAALSCIFTGRTIEAVAGTASILFLPTGIYLLIASVQESFLYGFVSENGMPFLSDKYTLFVPFGITEYFVLPNTPDDKIAQTTLVLSSLFWILILSLLFIGLKRWFSKGFKAENIGFKGINKWIVYISSLSAPLYVLVYIFSAIPGMYAIRPSVSFRLLSLAIGIGAGVITALILNTVFNFTFRKLKTGLLSAGTLIVLTLGLLGFSFTDGLGAYNKVPEIKEIDAIEINAPFSCFFIDELEQHLIRSSASPSEIKLLLTSEKDIETAVELQNVVAKEGEGNVSSSLKITYHLKNGKEISRFFKSTTEKSNKELLKLWDTDEAKAFYKKLLFPNIKTEKTAENYGQFSEITISENTCVSLDCATGPVGNVTLTEREFIELKNAVYKDICNMTWEDWFFPEEKPIGCISFSYSENQEFFPVPLDFNFPVSEKTVNTLEALKKNELYSFLKPTRRPATALLCTVEDLTHWYMRESFSEKILYSPYFKSYSLGFSIPGFFDALEYSEDYPPVTVLTDMAEIEELMEKGYPARALSTDDRLLFIKYSKVSFDSLVIPN